jgi:dTDP-glucose 4,6-dehydratase
MANKTKQKNILVTGGAGFIGSHLCRYLLAAGHRVICMDNLITGSKNNIKDLMKNNRFTFIKYDVTKKLRLNGRIDWVMHLASLASPKYYWQYPIKTLKSGFLGTHNCLGLSKAKNARFLLASTSEIYGDPAVHPQTEDYWGNVNPIGERSCYDESKRGAEALAYAYWRQHKVQVRVARIFNTYGPYMQLDDGRVVSNFIVQALLGKDITICGDGKQTRSFCYVDDLVAGLVKLMESDYQQPVNLGNPGEFKIIELAEIVLRLVKSKSKLKFTALPADDPKQRCPDITRAQQILSWAPKVNLEQGLIKAIPYFKAKLKP